MFAGQVLARITGDNSGLRRATSQSVQDLRSFGSAAQRAGQQANLSLRATSNGALIASTSIMKLRTSIVGVAAGIGVFKILTSAIEAAKSATIDFNSQQEQASIGFKTMLGSAKAADQYMGKLRQFAVATPFEFPQLVQASQNMLAFGFSARKILPNLRAIGDTIAALGGTMDYQGSIIIRAFGQMQAKGKTSAEEMMQLSEAGVSAWRYLAEGLGTSVSQAMEMSEKKLIDSSTAIEHILAGMEKNFGGMMEAQSKTLQGSISNVIDTARFVVADMTKPIYDEFKNMMGGLSGLLQSDQFKENATKAGKVISTGIKAGIGGIKTIAQPVIEGVQVIFKAIIEHREEIGAMVGDLADFAKGALSVAQAVIKMGAGLGTVVAAPALAGLKALTTLLGTAGRLLTQHKSLVVAVGAAYVGIKLGQLVSRFLAMATATMNNTKASILNANAVRVEAAAYGELTAAQMSSVAASKAIMTKSAASKFNSSLMNLGPSKWDAGPSMNIANKGLSRMQVLAKGAAAAVGGVVKQFTGLNGVMILGAAAIAAMSANTEQQTKVLDKMVSTGLAGAESLQEKYEATQKALKGSLPNDRDIAYSGGLWSDLGAAFKGAFDVGNWFNEEGAGGPKSVATATKKWTEESAKLLDEYKSNQKEALDKAHSDYNDYVNGLLTETAEMVDGVDAEYQKLRQAQTEAFTGMLDPLNNFKDQQGITFDDMIKNMYDNAQAVANWKENLAYLMSSGQTDVAAAFASMGPMSNQALSEMIQGGQPAIEAFRSLMKTGYENAGKDSTEALQEGLSKIPDIAAWFGIDLNGQMKKAVEDAAKAPLVLDETYRRVFKSAADGALANISTLFAGMDLSSEQSQQQLQLLADAFGRLKPEDLVGAGIDPETLGLPEVQAALAELVLDGRDNPVTINMAVKEALDDLGQTKEEIDAVIRPATDPYKMFFDIDATQANTRLDALKADIEAITGKDYSIKIDVGYQAPNAYNPTTGTYNPTNTGYSPFPGMPEADRLNGGIDSFAKGGMLPKAATIQSPGTLVQWAEPGTGGEAFIPLAASKRRRSLDIFMETGRRLGLGGRYVAFDGGGVMGAGYESSTSYGPKSKPAPWAFTPEKPKGGGTKAAAPVTAAVVEEAVDWFEIMQRMYDAGAKNDQEMLDWAKTYRDQQGLYTDEWVKANNTVSSITDKMQSDQEAIVKKLEDEAKARDEAAAAAKKQAQSVEDNRYKMGKYGDTNGLSDDQYVSILKERMAGLEQYSDEWTALWEQIHNIYTEKQDAINQAAADALAKERSMQDNMFDVGAMSAAQYETILQQRLVGLEQYSDEWTAVWQQLTQLQEQELEKQKQAQQEAADLTIKAADKIVDAYANLANSIANPIKKATDLVSAFGGNEMVSFQNLLDFYDNVTAGSQQWTAALDQLKALGLNSDTLNKLAQAGPNSLALAQSIIQGGAAGIQQLNSAAGAVTNIANGAGNSWANANLGMAVQGDNVGLQINGMTVDIDLSALAGLGLTKDQVIQIIESVFDGVATEIAQATAGG